MNKNQIAEQLQEKVFPEFKVLNIQDINHEPHPYTVGPTHITHASKHHNGIFDQTTLNVVPCAIPGCQLPYEEHTSNKVAFLQLTCNVNKGIANEKLKSIVDILAENKIDGISLVDTPEKFRIL